EIVSESGSDGGQSEQSDCEDEGRAAAEAISNVSRQRATQRHAGQAECEYRTKGRACQVPLANQGRDGEAKDLDIEAIEDDGECGQHGPQLLTHRPRRTIEQFADIDRVAQSPHTFRATSTTRASLAHCSSSVSELPSSVLAKPHCGLRQS